MNGRFKARTAENRGQRKLTPLAAATWAKEAKDVEDVLAQLGTGFTVG